MPGTLGGAERPRGSSRPPQPAGRRRGPALAGAVAFGQARAVASRRARAVASRRARAVASRRARAGASRRARAVAVGQPRAIARLVGVASSRAARLAVAAAAGAVVALATLVVTAAPASAHTVSGQGATNYRTQLIGVSPPVAGLDVKVVEGGLLVQVTWTGSAQLTDSFRLSRAPLGLEGPCLPVGIKPYFSGRRTPRAPKSPAM